MILTDEDIKAIYDNEKGGDYYDTVWAIEAAILEKLSRSEPVGVVSLQHNMDCMVGANYYKAPPPTKTATFFSDLEISTKLFTHPPAPVSAAREEIQRLRRIIDEEAKDSAQVIIERDKLLTLCDQLGEALEIAHELYANASQGYGFAKPENPHNYWPDIESCSPEEIAAHSQACSDYDAGKKVKNESWGIGTYSDEYTPALEALAAWREMKK